VVEDISCSRFWLQGILCGFLGWCRDDGPRRGDDDGGGGYKIGAAPGPIVSARKPVVCSANDLLFKSLDFSVLSGLEANVGNFLKIGGALFKNLTTGETGAFAGIKIIAVGYEIGTKNPPGVPLTTPGRPVTHTGSLGPLDHNFTTGETSVNLSMGASRWVSEARLVLTHRSSLTCCVSVTKSPIKEYETMATRGNLRWIAHLLAFLILGVLTLLALWLVMGTWMPKSAVEMGAVIAFFLCAPIGALWMLYDCAVREKPPFIYFLLAGVPYAFVWYYFDRVRPRKRRQAATHG
jgi:hypothetical protein